MRGVVITHLTRPWTSCSTPSETCLYITRARISFLSINAAFNAMTDRQCLDIGGLQPHNVYWEQHGNELEDTCTRTVSDSRCSKHGHQSDATKPPRAKRVRWPCPTQISGNAGIENPSICFQWAVLLAKTPGNPSPLFEIGTAEELIKFKTAKKKLIHCFSFSLPWRLDSPWFT